LASDEAPKAKNTGNGIDQQGTS